MCGISGFLQNSINERVIFSLLSMSSQLSHRGGDQEGIWNSNNIALAHQRLSIVDLSNNGKQPMLSFSSRYVITFNGEIYNHIYLRSKIEKLATGSPQIWRQ